MTVDAHRVDAGPATDLPTCDPAAVLLPAISALGAIAAIGVIPFVAQDRLRDRSRGRRKASVAVRDLETDCLQLQEVFRRLQRGLKSAPRAFAVATAPLKFGFHGLDLAPADLVADVARAFGSAARDTCDVMAGIEDGSIEAAEATCLAFGECQERLSRLLVDRASLKVAVEEGLAVAGRLTDLVRELKRVARD